MKRWNGKDETGSYQYPQNEIEKWNMQIDDDGTIYYTTQETIPQLRVWCPADRLTHHLRHLEQIAARC